MIRMIVYMESHVDKVYKSHCVICHHCQNYGDKAEKCIKSAENTDLMGRNCSAMEKK